MTNNNLYIEKLFLKLLIIKIDDIDRYKLNKYTFIAKSMIGNLNYLFFEMNKFGPASKEIYDSLNEFEYLGYIHNENNGKITQINSYQFFKDIKEALINVPLVVGEFENAISFLKEIEPFIEDFPDKELFTSILFFVRDEEIFTLKKLYQAVRLHKEYKFNYQEFLVKCLLLKIFRFVDIDHGEVSLVDNPLEEWNLIRGNRAYFIENPLERNKLLKPSYEIIKFFERNANKMRYADPEFLMRNSKSFQNLLKKFKKYFSSTVGNGLN